MGLREDMADAVKDLTEGAATERNNESAFGGEEHDFRTPLDKAKDDSAAGAAPSKQESAAPRARDDKGKFAPRTPAKEPAPVTAEATAGEEGTPPSGDEGEEKPDATPQPAQSKRRAPVSWSPEEREGWDSINPKSQAAILRREQEINSALYHTADARRFYDDMGKIIAPYLPMIQAEGSNPVQAIQYLLDTSAKLRTAPAQQKTDLVADMIMQFGIDLEMLDTAITSRLTKGGKSGAQPNNDVVAQLRNEFKPLFDFVQSQQSQAETVSAKEAEKIWTDFVADPKYPYAEDVREEMADLLMMYASRGKQLSLQDAYKLATMRHPVISKELETQGEQSTAQRSAAARRAREASASLPSSGAPLPSGEESSDGSLRGDLLASINQLSSSRR